MSPDVYHPPDPFLYQASVVRLVTPDTYDLHVDAGFSITREIRVQLRGVSLPDDYDPSDDDNKVLSYAADWFDMAAAADHAGEFPLWIRTYRTQLPGPDTGEPGEVVYEVDVVRKFDAANLRKSLTDRFTGVENGLDTDEFDFFRGRDQSADGS